jgi:protein-L-isoaspartate(D-aspartate) O-methyltransferase
MRAQDFEILRRHMLAEISAWILQLRDTIGKTALDERVMMALGKVPRHAFVPIELQPYAYANIPLPIGFDKTISQPFIVGLMTDLLAPVSAIRPQSWRSWLTKCTASR